ncbi:ATP-dependent DNA helicase [Actinomadura rugatobispora]|uniref:ATP-dependent RecD-like DNA helicase n=1 Tax=Actinomadura rugatobispora TaxID=1994 RepID=A0ABW1ADL4_9ACTN|nr:hypothetical protein GCM10010200_075960 [Actinomadura rugatobispora]
MGQRRDDSYELAHAGKALYDLEAHRVGCLTERGTFLSRRPFQYQREHPYGFTPALKGRIKPTPVTVPAFGAHATPYFWLHRKNVDEVVNAYNVDYLPEREDAVDAALGFPPEWVLHGDNQQALIERFFEDVDPADSLVFFYAKHSPFDSARNGGPLLVGAARVTDVQLPGRWLTDGASAFPNHMWETAVLHSLRSDGTGGMLLPVADLARLDEEGEDVTQALAWAPAIGREFAYVTEHVSHDTAIAALERLFHAAQRCRKLGLDIPEHSLQWVDDRIGELWTMRGPMPGLGAVLGGALKFPHSQVLARAVARHTPDGTDPWEVLADAIANPVGCPGELNAAIPDTHRKMWRTSLTPEHLRVLRLLARFHITPDQAAALFKGSTEIEVEHGELLDDPYNAYVCTVGGPDPVPFDVVDRGCFPQSSVRARFPLQEPTAMTDGADARRVQALLVAVLEEAAQNGDTLVPMDRAMEMVEARRLAEPCPISEPILRAHRLHPDQLRYSLESPYWPPLTGAKLADGTPTFKLTRLETTAQVIRKVVDAQIARPRITAPSGLRSSLDQVLGSYQAENDDDSQAEDRARLEKAAALEELYSSPLSVLNGRAGTGKTTLIKALTTRDEVRGKGVLLLAPTGKARVQLQTKVGLEAQTIAQFLTKCRRYDGRTNAYIIDGTLQKAPRYGTVVVDESSMLTEEQLGALLDALVFPDRLILVGDPRQLPPIGSGRPFVDLISYLTAGSEVPRFPRVAQGYAELTELRRQKGGHVRDDLMLASWFSGDEVPQGFEEVWERLRNGSSMERLGAVPWQGVRPTETLDELLRDEIGITDDDPSGAFEVSYGGQRNGKWVNFPWGRGGAASRCEDWQILSPTRGRGWGTVEINRHLKRTYRSKALADALKPRRDRTTPPPLGTEQIVLGDKVLNNSNGKSDAYPRGTGLDYVANGEIGVVVGRLGKRGSNPRWTDVEFSSQTGATYRYSGESEDDPTLELAWAMTIHKSQGSEFRKVFVMLPGSARRLSREMLYTALTRQQERVVLLHERSIDELLDLTVSTGSDTARRLTDLFTPPAPRQVQFADGSPAGVMDANRVHITANGTVVRSKNEVIIAGIVDELAPGLWQYERRLTLNGATYKPDFTIVTPDGRTIYWEHLGMLDNAGYKAMWDRKERWYRYGGVIPYEEGGGPQGTLLRTNDLNGVNVQAWTELARAAIGPISAGPVISSKKKIKKSRPGEPT